ncbi:hypothetical protein ZOSMA_59G00780 [Zostera marina]|uniref:Protein TIFY n=1 Tax=Zostera marina TaxID=29655 RepID=A0A0K9NWU7_ZOSMR|nr:hypothetical protein ZOSMA_59G00780 [Zostera marina]
MTDPPKSVKETVELDFFPASGKRMTPRKTVVGGEGVASAFNGGQLLHLGNPSSTAPPPHDASSSSISSGVASTGGAGGCTSPMTIFYNGSVSVFQVPADKAMTLMMMAEMAHAKVEVTEIASQSTEMIAPSSSITTTTGFGIQHFHDIADNGDNLVRARRLSLQRFMERRSKKTKINQLLN